MIQFGSNTTGKSKCCFAYPVEIPEIKRASVGFVKSIPIRNSLALTKYQHVLREFCETNWIKKQPENRGVFNVWMIQFGSNKTGISKHCFVYHVEIIKKQNVLQPVS